MKIVTKEKMIEHPLEDVFDIEAETTVVEYKEAIPAEVVQMPTYDEKDVEIEDKLEEVYTLAMGNAAAIGDEMERIEGKYKARVGEVTATMLNVALGAIREKRELKMHKDKMGPTGAATGNHTTNNNLIVADRNDLIKALADKIANSK